MPSVIHLVGGLLINLVLKGAQEFTASEKFSVSVLLEHQHYQFRTYGPDDWRAVLV